MNIYVNPNGAVEDLVNTLQTGDSGLAEWCLLGKGGTEHDCEARASVIRDSSWNPLYLVNVMRDITERKKREAEIIQQNTELEVLTEISAALRQTDKPADMAAWLIKAPTRGKLSKRPGNETVSIRSKTPMIRLEISDCRGHIIENLEIRSHTH